MEVVYHLFNTTGGPVLNLKVQVLRKDPIEIPSLVSIYPGADFQEREIWDFFWNCLYRTSRPPSN